MGGPEINQGSFKPKNEDRLLSTGARVAAQTQKGHSEYSPSAFVRDMGVVQQHPQTALFASATVLSHRRGRAS